MAPEQARGEATDHRADLFSLGSTLYAMCAGHPPFRAESPLAVLRRVSDDEPRPVRQINPEVPEWLEAIVTRLHSKDPAGRFPSASELAGLLSRCLAHVQQPLAVPLPAELARTALRPDPRRGRRLLWAGAGLLGFAVVLAGVPLIAPRRPSGPEASVPSAGDARRRTRRRPTRPRAAWMTSINRPGKPGNGLGRSRPSSIVRPIPPASMRYPNLPGAWPIEPRSLERELVYRPRRGPIRSDRFPSFPTPLTGDDP